MRVRNRTLQQTDISWLCEEIGINLILHDIDDSRKEKSRLVRNEKGATKYKFKNGYYKDIERKVGNKNLGDEESLITIEMNCYKGHYFLEERTNISSWYVDHIDTASLSQMHGWHKGNAFFTPKDKSKYESRYLMSGQLVRRLLNKGMFEELKHIDLIDEEMLAKRNIMLDLIKRDARSFAEDSSCDDECCVEYYNEYSDDDWNDEFCGSCDDEF